MTRATQHLQDATEKRNDELVKELAAKQAMLLDAVNRINSLIAEQIVASDGTFSSVAARNDFRDRPTATVLPQCAQGPTDAHDRRSPRVSPTEEAFNPTDQRVLTAFLAWPDSPVWVLLYWLGTRSTSHVHTPPSPLQR